MGIVQKDAVRTSIISFAGIGLGYLNKAVLFVLLFSTAQVGLLNLLMSVGLLFAQFANLGTIYTTWRFFPFLEIQPSTIMVFCLQISFWSLLDQYYLLDYSIF